MLETSRVWYGFYVCGFVVMPEHVHLLISEPERKKLAITIQMLKQNTARELKAAEALAFGSPAITISMCGAKLSESRSSATYIAIQ